MNLSALRNYRAQIEDALKAELAALQRELDAALEEQAGVQRIVDEEAGRYLSESQAGMAPEDATLRCEGIEDLTDQVRRMESGIEQLREECERKRVEVLEAARETQKLELLWERHIARTRRAQERRDQQNLDESAARRHQRLREEARRGNQGEQESVPE